MNPNEVKMKNYDVFISYSRRDLDIVNSIAAALTKKNYTVFTDFTSITTGANFNDVFIDVLKASDLFLLICTPNSLASNWVYNELNYVINAGKIVIPVIVDNFDLPANYKFILSTKQWIDYDSSNITQSTKQLVDGIIPYLNRVKHGSESATIEDTHNEIEDKSESLETSAPTSEISTPQKAQNQQQTGSVIRKVLSITGIVILILLYLICVCGSFISEDYLTGIGLLVPVLLSVVGLFVLQVKSSKYDLKLYCETEDTKEKSTITISVDDRVVATLQGQDFVRLSEKSGDYLISVKSSCEAIATERFVHTFGKNNHGAIKQITLKAKDSKHLEKKTNEIATQFMSFIAGSTRLVNERNAVRAVLSVLYNKWERYNLVISSYTFEDFSNSYTVGGQQMRYDEFIANKAHCAIFIVENGIGPKTLNEYRLSIKTFEENGQRPKIFVYANSLNQEETTLQFIEEVRKHNSYWREYTNIPQLMNLVKEDIDGELFNIFILKNGLK